MRIQREIRAIQPQKHGEVPISRQFGAISKAERLESAAAALCQVAAEEQQEAGDEGDGKPHRDTSRERSVSAHL